MFLRASYVLLRKGTRVLFNGSFIVDRLHGQSNYNHSRFGWRWRDYTILHKRNLHRVPTHVFMFSLQDNTTANTNTTTRRLDVCSKAFACASWTARCTPRNVLSPWCPWRRRSKKTDSWCRTHTWNWLFCTKPKETWIRQRTTWKRQSTIKSRDFLVLNRVWKKRNRIFWLGT